jgi:hypothetical protein
MEAESSSDVVYIGGAALRRIEKETGQDLSRWSGPKVTTDGDTDYKVEWYPPDDDDAVNFPGYDDAVLTIYKTGDWDLYALNGKAYTGRMMCLHDIRWIRTLTNGGCIPELAKSSWMYFKLLATK